MFQSVTTVTYEWPADIDVIGLERFLQHLLWEKNVCSKNGHPMEVFRLKVSKKLKSNILDAFCNEQPVFIAEKSSDYNEYREHEQFHLHLLAFHSERLRTKNAFQ